MKSKLNIEKYEDVKMCNYYLIKFFGADFAPELVNSPHGFILRAKNLQEIPALTEELMTNY